MNIYWEMMKNHGLKLTVQRKSVIELFAREKSGKTPYEVRRKLAKKIPHLGLPTVYRILEELKEIGVLVQIPSEDRQLYYSICRLPADKHHHHFICRKCRRTEEVDFCNFKGIAGHLRRQLGAKLETHMMHLEGLCADCQ
jgi:Fur family zinc uptake transcriptional regulator